MKGMNFGGQKISVTSKITDAKYILSDDTEIPVKIILEDPDLDIAFIAPKKPLTKC